MRPVWLQGSRVTTAVSPAASGAPFAVVGSFERASASACGVPAPRCQPAVTISPAGLRRTQPTRGLPPVSGPCPASSSARRIARSYGSSPCRVLALIRSSGLVGETYSGVAKRGIVSDRGLSDHSPRRARKRVLPPIRTLTVGPGVSPDRPPSTFERSSRTLPPARTFTDPGARASFHRIQRPIPSRIPGRRRARTQLRNFRLSGRQIDRILAIPPELPPLVGCPHSRSLARLVGRDFYILLSWITSPRCSCSLWG